MIRRFLQNFFIGRNGFDHLARFAWVLWILFLLLAMLPGIAGVIFEFLSFAAMAYTLFRMLSRNVYKRADENRRFLDKTAGIRSYLRGVKMRLSQRKDYKFFKCPTCHAMLRVPRGKGKLQITCRKCGNRFSGKT